MCIMPAASMIFLKYSFYFLENICNGFRYSAETATLLRSVHACVTFTVWADAIVYTLCNQRREPAKQAICPEEKSSWDTDEYSAACASCKARSPVKQSTLLSKAVHFLFQIAVLLCLSVTNSSAARDFVIGCPHLELTEDFYMDTVYWGA